MIYYLVYRFSFIYTICMYFTFRFSSSLLYFPLFYILPPKYFSSYIPVYNDPYTIQVHTILLKEFVCYMTWWCYKTEFWEMSFYYIVSCGYLVLETQFPLYTYYLYARMKYKDVALWHDLSIVFFKYIAYAHTHTHFIYKLFDKGKPFAFSDVIQNTLCFNLNIIKFLPKRYNVCTYTYSNDNIAFKEKKKGKKRKFYGNNMFMLYTLQRVNLCCWIFVLL